MQLKESVKKYIDDKVDYHKQWILEEPIVVTERCRDEVKRLQNIMFKMITHFVNEYDQYHHLMPVSERIRKILKMAGLRKYQPGTYRTDFVFDASGQMKLIEITCRFGMNGMFISGLMNHIAEEYRSVSWPDLEVHNLYDGLIDHLAFYLKNKESVHVLIGEDRKNESKIFDEIFERVGLPVVFVECADVSNRLNEMKNSFIISELSFDEILSFPDNIISELSRLGVFNDFRTIFLIHDKRFFSVLGNLEFQTSILTEEEIAIFTKFYILTYNRTERLDHWDDARSNKPNWIIKHRSLGKSQMVYAGIVTDISIWDSLFEDDHSKDYVLQHWIPQTKIAGQIGHHKFEDFITGTLLFFDDHFFGFGDFRTSSHPVTNKTDHRKMCSVILKHDSAKYAFTNIIK